MKKLLILTLLSLTVSAALFAQRGPRGEQAKERIEAYKIAFFTEKLQLTPEESKAFWPVYNEYEDARTELRQKYRMDGKRLELLSDSELEDYIEQQLKMEEEMVKLRREYVYKFKEILPIRKVAMLQKVDNEFKRELLKELRQRQQNRMNPNRPGNRRN
ncbi:MAG: hypothetical protein CMN32_16650 [Saprospirales bacterium]|nr:hypothetical protein [Saprospirales bacterium]